MRRRGWIWGSVMGDIDASGGRVELVDDCGGEDCGGCEVRGIAACCGCLEAVGVAPGGGA